MLANFTKVVHPKYGQGRIVEAIAVYRKYRYKIEFHNVTKWLFENQFSIVELV